MFDKRFVFKNSFPLLRSTLETMVVFMLKAVDGLRLPWMLRRPRWGPWSHMLCVPKGLQALPYEDDKNHWNLLLFCISRSRAETRTQLLWVDYVLP